MAQNLDPATRQAFEPRHRRLANLNHVVQDRASILGQKMERQIQNWDLFSDRFSEMQAWLNQLRSHMPEAIDEAETLQPLDQLRKAIWNHHNIQKESSGGEESQHVWGGGPRLRQLVHGVQYPGLEAEVTEFAEQWVELSNRCNTEHKRWAEIQYYGLHTSLTPIHVQTHAESTILSVIGPWAVERQLP